MIEKTQRLSNKVKATLVLVFGRVEQPSLGLGLWRRRSFNVPPGLVSLGRTMIIDDDTMMTMACDFIKEDVPFWLLAP